MSLSENIAKCRKEKGYTQVELAERLEIAQPMIAQYEKGLKIPNIITGVELAKALGTTCEELVK